MRFTKNIKFKLTIWYLAVLTVLLLVFSVMAYLILSHSLYQKLDDSLKLRTVEIQNSLDIENGDISFEETDQWVFQEQVGELVLLYNVDRDQLQKSESVIEITQLDTLIGKSFLDNRFYVTIETIDSQEVRLYVAPLGTESSIHAALVVARSTAEIKDVLERFKRVLLFAIPATLILAGVGGLFLAKRSLKPMEHITQTAHEIQESDLSRRIEVRNEDEVGRLASTLNKMIERLQKAFGRQQQFTADASHELRTPLAVIRAEATLGLRKKRTKEDYQESLELISQEASRMSTTIDELLVLARTDAGTEQMNFDKVNLKELLADLASDIEILCQEKAMRFQLGSLDNLVVRGDKVKLNQLFLNLIDNAIRYTPSGGSVSVSLVDKGETAVIAVKDTGIGIPEEHIPHIFERFYRVDKARSPSSGGTGLGLSICQRIAELHGGRVTVESQVGKGSIFSVLLPVVERS